MTSNKIVTVIAGLCLTASALFAQNTIQVPGDQPTIQAGINVANSGDTVLVAPGTYSENVDFQGKNITVASLSGASVTTIKGTGVGPVVIFDDNSAASGVLQGFTITGGACAFIKNQYLGGGIYVGVGETPTITGNTITNNRGCDGAGISIYGAGPVIQNNVITHNQQYGYSGGNGGGGIQILGGAVPAQVIGNTITDNAHTNWGGGIGMNGGGVALIKNNFIARNTAYNAGGGISMINGSAPLIVQNVIVDNVVTNNSGSGGGVYWILPGSPTALSLLNNTIVGNTASQGSAVYADGFPPVALVTNNILVGTGTGGAVYCSSYPNYVPTFNSNDVFNTSGPAYTGLCTDQTGINGNIFTDPSFVSASAGNYRLNSGSPAVDAGSNAAPNLPQNDYSGNPRILDGNNDCVSTVDMGAYELVGAAKAAFSSSSLSFPIQLVGTSSSPQPVSLSNTGNSCFQFSGLQMLGDFSQTNNCSLAGVRGGSSCTYYVTFTPTALGSRTGALSVTGSDGVTTSSPNVSLIGTGTTLPPAVSLSPTQLTFAAQPIGTTSAAQVVTLTNTGGASLSIGVIYATGQFSETNNCPASLAGGGACTISVTFASNTAGTQSGYVSITDNASGSPQSVSLSGTASDFAISVTPNVVTVKHGGTAQFLITVPAVGGPFDWSVTLSCSGLPSGATCNFSPARVMPGNSGTTSTLKLSTNPSTTHGTFLVDVIGRSDSLQHSAQMTLTVK
jgi:parallel beta-helix repeat protein